MAFAVPRINARPALEMAGAPFIKTRWTTETGNASFGADATRIVQRRTSSISDLWLGGSFWSLLIIGLLVFVWFAYRLRVAQLKNRQARQEEFSRRLIASQEGERKRIATELHDGLSQSLVIIKNRALSSLNAPEDHDRAFEQLREIAEAATQVIDEVKEIIYDLHPIQLERLGLKGAIEDLLGNVGDSHPLKITRELDDTAGLLSKEAETSLYRIVQESVNNTIKHARAGEMTVRMKRDTSFIELTIKDDGEGFAPGEKQNGSSRGGVGLTSIVERAKLLGGESQIESALGRGTTISIKLPMKEDRNVR